MRYSRSKYRKHVILMKSPAIVPHLPETRRFDREAFRSFLEQYGHVIVKPVGGWGGDGVISVSTGSDGRVEARFGKLRKSFYDANDAYAYVRSVLPGRSCIVQRRISLATVNGKPFDLRVMVQRKRGGSWMVTGKLAKVAGAGYLITNVRRSGGKVVSFSEAMRQSNLHGVSAAETERRIDALALAAAEHLQRYYRIRVCGLDVGLDDRGKIWIIEANFTPDLGLFRKLKDRSTYRRILEFDRGETQVRAGHRSPMKK
ncbi:MAG TPA: YheC/YheD family protein [Paenibacillus sp.]|nr:YheC/YheD family protein [Paenibacillus sp.]